MALATSLGCDSSGNSTGGVVAGGGGSRTGAESPPSSGSSEPGSSVVGSSCGNHIATSRPSVVPFQDISFFSEDSLFIAKTKKFLQAFVVPFHGLFKAKKDIHEEAKNTYTIIRSLQVRYQEMNCFETMQVTVTVKSRTLHILTMVANNHHSAAKAGETVLVEEVHA